MKAILLFTCFLGVVLLLGACNDETLVEPSLPCTAEWVRGLHVEVRDAETGLPAACGATIIAQDGAYVETLDVFVSPCMPRDSAAWAYGAGERPGDYQCPSTR
jgi:hypothetical protein